MAIARFPSSLLPPILKVCRHGMTAGSRLKEAFLPSAALLLYWPFSITSADAASVSTSKSAATKGNSISGEPWMADTLPLFVTPRGASCVYVYVYIQEDFPSRARAVPRRPPPREHYSLHALAVTSALQRLSRQKRIKDPETLDRLKYEVRGHQRCQCHVKLHLMAPAVGGVSACMWLVLLQLLLG